MKLELKTKNKQGKIWVPDWIEFGFIKNGIKYYLRVKIKGILSDLNGIDYVCQSDICPWIFYDEFGNTEHLNSSQQIFPLKKIQKIINESFDIKVGVYTDSCIDEFEDGKGLIEIFNEDLGDFYKEFRFEIVKEGD